MGLGLNETTLGNWIKKAAEAEAAGDGEPAPTVQELKRIRDLEAEVRRLNLEVAFLKKGVPRGAAREMEDCWPFGAALRGEASNRRLLR